MDSSVTMVNVLPNVHRVLSLLDHHVLTVTLIVLLAQDQLTHVLVVNQELTDLETDVLVPVPFRIMLTILLMPVRNVMQNVKFVQVQHNVQYARLVLLQ